MNYTEEFAKKVLSKINIVELISQYTKLDLQSDNIYSGKCVFHNDGGDSLIVYADEQSFHCFGCGKSGNAAMFLAEKEGLSMNQALEKLAKIAKVEIEPSDIAKKTNDVLRSNLYDIYTAAAFFYLSKMKSEEGKKAWDYLEERKITKQTAERFGLGYSPEKGNALYKHLKSKGFSDELMIESGLIRISETGPYDMFRGRLIFPIIDENKKVIAFGGRRLDDESEQAKRQPKYLNSPETLIFNKSNTFYGVNDLKGANRDYFLLCEGYMDVISLHQAGFKNSVATLGTAFTKTHVPVIKKYTDSLILTFDCDGAGQKAAMRTLKALDGSDMHVKILSMDPCKDPDEFIKTFGKERYQDRIDRSMEKVDFQLKFLASQYDLKDPKQKQEYLTKAVESIMKDSQEHTKDHTPVLDR